MAQDRDTNTSLTDSIAHQNREAVDALHSDAHDAKHAAKDVASDARDAASKGAQATEKAVKDGATAARDGVHDAQDALDDAFKRGVKRGEELAAAARHKAQEAVDGAKSWAKDAAHMASDQFAHVREAVASTGAQARSTAKDTYRSAEGCVKDRPATALAGAVAFGFVLGLLAHQNRR